MSNDEIITIEGIRKLKKMNRNEWPLNWMQLVENYIDVKRKIILLKKKKGRDISYDKELLQEAIDFYLKNGFRLDMKLDPSKLSMMIKF
jgi:hypothetical protein